MLPSLDHARTALRRAEGVLRAATVNAEIAKSVVDEAQRKAAEAWGEVAVCEMTVEALRQQIEFDESVMAAVAAKAAERSAAGAH